MTLDAAKITLNSTKFNAKIKKISRRIWLVKICHFNNLIGGKILFRFSTQIGEKA